MAIGLGRMLGFEFMENFNYPYLASSVTDFWRRWHISLSSWFREYVYIPLGGNRKGLSRQFINMGVIWFLTGFWHGAAWNFILWGVFYFIFLALEKAFLLKWFEKNTVTRALGHIWALVLVGIGWMIFDHTDLSEAFAIMGGMLGHGYEGADYKLFINMDEASGYTGKMYTTGTATCYKVMAMCSHATYVLNGVETSSPRTA